MSQLRRAISPGVVLVAERDCLTPRTLNTLQLALLCYTTYYFLVLCYGESDELAVSIWSLNLEIAPSVIATFMVRCFFTVRLWHLSQGNRTLICTIMAFAFPQLGIGLGMCVASFQKNKFSELPRYMGLMTAQMSAAATADILITASLLYYLKQSKEFGTRRTNSLINRLIVWTVNTALLTGVAETAQVISWVSATNTLIFLPFHLILAKLYTCSMLAMLNGRRRLRKSFDEPHTLPLHRSSIVITLHDDPGSVLNETGPVDEELSNRGHSKFEAPTSAMTPPEPSRKDMDGGSSEHSPEV